ncbi:MAG TPA: ATP-binding protein [Bacteroidales bacterium]|nr:ATP-binding protein [Bacteroidales bacterium]
MGKIHSLLFFVGLTAILIVGSLVYYYNEAKSIREDKLKELQAISELKISQISQWQKERYSEAGFFSKNKLVVDATEKLLLKPGRDTSLVSFFKPITSFDRYENIFITDTLANVVFSMNDQYVIDNVTQNHILQAKKQAGIYFSGFYYCTTHQKIHDDYVAPVKLNEKVLGFLVLRNDPERYLYPLIQKWPLPSRTSETILVVREGDSVVFVNDVRFIGNAALRYKEPLINNEIAAKAAVSGKIGLYEGLDYKGSKVLAFLSPVSGTPWFMVAKIDKKEVLAELKYRAIVVMAAVSGILIIASLGLILLNRSKETRLFKELYKTELAEKEAIQKLNETQEEVRLLNTRLEMLIDIIKDLTLAQTIEQSQQIIAASARELMHSDGASFVFLENDGCFYAEENAIEPLWKGKWFPLNDCISGYSMIKKEPVIVPDIYKDDRISTAHYSGTFVRSLMVVPVNTIEPLGAIGCYWKENYTPSEIEVRLMQTLADAASRTIDNILLYKNLEDRVKQRTIQLEEVNKELETFTYSVSHDLKAPLRGIDGYSKLLMDISESWLGEEPKQYLKSIRNSAKLMNELIEDLLEYSRVERNKISNQVIRIKNLVNSLLAVFQSSITTQYAISVNIPDREINADLRGLTIILRNFIENAIKFSGTKPQPEIVIDLNEDNAYWTISIKDNGIGFDMKYKRRIFEIFQRLHRSEDYPGTGIGLAIVAKAAQRMKCNVWAESVPSEGSVFYLQIPKTHQIPSEL